MAAEVMKRRDELPADLAEELDSVFESFRMNAEKINEHGRRAEGIVQNMLEHSKAGEGQRTPVAINSLLDEYVTLALHGRKAQDPDFDIHVDREYDEEVGQVDILPQEMGRVFMNLIGNAFDALKQSVVDGRGSEVAPVVTVSTKKDGPNIEIRISDNGPGIPEKVKARIFEPFFTTKPTGSGTGLGLSMSYDIVTKGHNGSLEVESVEGQGASFIITLPI
jgi:signal transduction histidine kinase